MGFVRERSGARGTVYMAFWRDPASGKQRSKTFHTKTEAEEYLTVTSASVITGTYFNHTAGRVRYRDWFPLWLEQDVDRRVQPKTSRQYRYLGERLLIPFFGNMPIASITKPTIASWTTWCESQGFKAWTTRNAFTVLAGSLSYAELTGRIASNPCIRMARVLPKVDEKRQRPTLTPQEVLGLADVVKPRYRALVLLLAVHGLRPGEAIGLRLSDLNLLEGYLTIRRSVTNNHGTMVVGPPKTPGSAARVDLLPFVQDALETHIRDFVDLSDDDAILFSGERSGGWIHESYLRVIIKNAGEKLGIDLVPYDLRSIAATNIVSITKNPKTAQTMLRHIDPRITLRIYAQSTPTSIREAEDEISKAFGF